MKKQYFYTSEEDTVIISEIMESPYNLQNAFRKASLKTGRSQDAISYHWYKSLRNKRGAIFMTVSGKRCTVNGKNVVILNDNTTTVKRSIWNKIKSVLKL